ncbi:MAG: hypothetical protein JO132_05625 [Streptosporangiaceae bacterium]|nr:hypothetical protein [Streptosporangiaceae bacterium]
MSGEGAETYLRLLAEAELRRAAHAADGWEGPAGHGEPGTGTVAAEIALWRIRRAGRILAAAGALDEESAERAADDLRAALTVRSRGLLSRSLARRPAAPPWMLLASGGAAPRRRAPTARHAGVSMRAVPVGRTLQVADGRAPSALHFMSLVRTAAEAVITVVMRMHWPADGSSTDLEITGAGPHHLPYRQLWASDNRGAGYSVVFDGDGGTASWQGVVRLSPAPARGTRWLDLVGDGTALLRLHLVRQAARQPGPAVEESAAPPPAERLLTQEAERILAAAWDARGPTPDPDLGEIVTVLTHAGAIAADSPAPGQLAALYGRLGLAGHGIAVPAAAEIPAPWASVAAQREAAPPASGQEVFTPLAVVLPEIDGARFALAGLSCAAGESHLHVVAAGMPPPADRLTHIGSPGFSWWLKDGAGNWHVGRASEACTLGDGTQAFRLRLAPPLAAVPDTAEVVVTGPATRARAAVAVRPAPQTSED